MVFEEAIIACNPAASLFKVSFATYLNLNLTELTDQKSCIINSCQPAPESAYVLI